MSLKVCYDYGIAADGILGIQTRSSLIPVQKKIGVAVDGEYGYQTYRHMLSAHQAALGRILGLLTSQALGHHRTGVPDGRTRFLTGDGAARVRRPDGARYQWLEAVLRRPPQPPDPRRWH